MKQKLLFIHPTMDFGGAEKSLQTLLCQLDYTRFDVDLLLFRPEGALLPLLPPDVRLLPPGDAAQTFSLPLTQACAAFLRQGKVSSAAARALFSLRVRSSALPRVQEQRGWKYQKKAFSAPPTEYDAAIAYLEGAPLYYCADLVRAGRKIAYIHNDYKKLQTDPSFDAPYLARMDAVVTVSQACADSLRDSFPALADKVRVVENMISPAVLRRAAQEDVPFDPDYHGLRLLTMGRLEPQKGYDLALKACAALAPYYDFRWYVLGEGPQRQALEAQIRSLHLEDRFQLLGTRLNPYPYLDRCDIYVQPSRFEGKSIALEEAKALQKPILTTAFTTVADQITDGVNGSVAQIDASSLAERLRALLKDPALRERYSAALRDYAGNPEELDRFYALLTQ